MGKRRDWPEELAERCRAVGWTAELTRSGHYKVQVPAREGCEGGGFSMASTPSTRDGERKALNKANRLGLERLEQRMRLQREKERLERIQRDREQNGVPDEDFAPDNQPESETQAMPNLGYIEVAGVKLGIADTGPAFYQPNRGGEPRKIEDARELLLVDETVRYQCLKPTPGRPDKLCERTFEKAAGLHVHQGRMHQAPAPRPGPTREEILADREPSAGPNSTEPAPEQPEPGVMARTVRLAEDFAAFCDQLGDLADLGSRLNADLQELAQELPNELASDELRDKAARFDAMLRAAAQPPTS